VKKGSVMCRKEIAEPSVQAAGNGECERYQVYGAYSTPGYTIIRCGTSGAFSVTLEKNLVFRIA